MVLGDPTICIYLLTFDNQEIDNTHIIQYFVMHTLGI